MKAVNEKHICPICNGNPIKRESRIDCDDECFNPYRGKCEMNHKPYTIETACDFCDGVGQLDKAPIPIIVGWRKVP